MLSDSSVNDLKSFIANAKSILKRFENELGWSSPDFEKYNMKVCCVDSSHVVSPEK